MDTEVTEAETDKNLVDFFQTNPTVCVFHFKSELVEVMLNKTILHAPNHNIKRSIVNNGITLFMFSAQSRFKETKDSYQAEPDC